ncbi:MAG: sulfotransferase [Myxococcales bacterium]|nr:sulfotransferase [Myxococcales bacterium]
MIRAAFTNPTGASPLVRTLLAALEPLSAFVPLHATEQMDRAVQTTGLSDWGEPSFRAGLDALLAAADGDARLSAVGRITLRNAVDASLRNRLHFVQARKLCGAAMERPVRRPLLIAAMPRTGSSLLQRLLASHPDALSIPLWLGLRPTPAPDRAEWVAGGSRGRRRGAWWTALGVRTLQPAMMAKHPVGVDHPVECAYFMMSTFMALQWWAVWPVYDYAEWFARQSVTPAYRTFREHLQLVQHPLPGTHWVLKSPGHFLRMEEALSVLPEARVVRLHRDPVQVLASNHSLFATAQGLMSSHLAHDRIASINESALAAAAHRAVASAHRTDRERVMDVRYEDLVADPAGVVRRIHRWAGVRHDEGVERCLRRVLQDDPRRRYGRHRYSAEQLVDAPAVRERFGAYMERFL